MRHLKKYKLFESQEILNIYEDIKEVLTELDDLDIEYQINFCEKFWVPEFDPNIRRFEVKLYRYHLENYPDIIKRCFNQLVNIGLDYDMKMQIFTFGRIIQHNINIPEFVESGNMYGGDKVVDNIEDIFNLKWMSLTIRLIKE